MYLPGFMFCCSTARRPRNSSYCFAKLSGLSVQRFTKAKSNGLPLESFGIPAANPRTLGPAIVAISLFPSSDGSSSKPHSRERDKSPLGHFSFVKKRRVSFNRESHDLN